MDRASGGPRSQLPTRPGPPARPPAAAGAALPPARPHDSSPRPQPSLSPLRPDRLTRKSPVMPVRPPCPYPLRSRAPHAERKHAFSNDRLTLLLASSFLSASYSPSSTPARLRCDPRPTRRALEGRAPGPCRPAAEHAGREGRAGAAEAGRKAARSSWQHHPTVGPAAGSSQAACRGVRLSARWLPGGVQAGSLSQAHKDGRLTLLPLPSSLPPSSFGLRPCRSLARPPPSPSGPSRSSTSVPSEVRSEPRPLLPRRSVPLVSSVPAPFGMGRRACWPRLGPASSGDSCRLVPPPCRSSRLRPGR